MKKKQLEYEYVNSILSYDELSGELLWKKRELSHFKSYHGMRVWNARFAGKVAGTPHSQGYIAVKIGSTSNLAHRVAWLLKTGRMPVNEIDHINGIKTDNSIANLRSVSRTQNMRNSCTPITNTSGTCGVRWSKHAKKWVAKICVDRKNIHLGYFSDKSLAIAARINAQKDYGFHDNHGRVSV